MPKLSYKGENNPFFGKKHTDESKKKMAKGLKRSFAEKGHPRQGAKFSEESKRKMSESRKKWHETHEHPRGHLGRKHSDETKNQIARSVSGDKNPFFGHKHTPDTLIKIGSAMRGKHHTPEVCEKISRSTTENIMRGKSHSHKRYPYIPGNRNKCRSKLPIVCKSKMEYKFCQFLDFDPKILEWGYEPIHVTYYHPTKKRIARYIPDFWIKTTNDIFIIELGAHTLKTIRGPSTSKNAKSRNFTNFHRIVNEAKFKAAEEFCNKKGWKWRIITEKQMFIYD